MQVKGKRHVSFPFRRFYAHETSLQAASLKLHLTLAMPAVITLLAAFLVDHGVTATLRTKIACDA